MADVIEAADLAAARQKAEAPISVMELFTIGIRPSGSHTLGPMRAAFRFAESASALHGHSIARDPVERFGSLTPTGNDMHPKYNKTRPGGLAVNFVAC